MSSGSGSYDSLSWLPEAQTGVHERLGRGDRRPYIGRPAIRIQSPTPPGRRPSDALGAGDTRSPNTTTLAEGVELESSSEARTVPSSSRRSFGPRTVAGGGSTTAWQTRRPASTDARPESVRVTPGVRTRHLSSLRLMLLLATPRTSRTTQLRRQSVPEPCPDHTCSSGMRSRNSRESNHSQSRTSWAVASSNISAPFWAVASVWSPRTPFSVLSAAS